MEYLLKTIRVRDDVWQRWHDVVTGGVLGDPDNHPFTTAPPVRCSTVLGCLTYGSARSTAIFSKTRLPRHTTSIRVSSASTAYSSAPE